MTQGGADRVASAFRAVPRAAFLPPDQRRQEGVDLPLDIGGGATNSQPSTVRTMLEFLDAGAGHRVLDVGAGSGWTTALLAHLTAPAGQVLGLELDPALASWGAGNLAAYRSARAAGSGAAGRPEPLAPARLEPADPRVLGCPAHAPYDRILVSAMAPRLPMALLAQLAPDGVLVGPVGGRMAVVRRVPGRPEPEVSWHGHYRFVPLIMRD